MIRKLARRDRDENEGTRGTNVAPLFDLDELHERRILSWSPEPEDDPIVTDAGVLERPPVEEAPPPPPQQAVRPAPTPEPVAAPKPAARPAPTSRPTPAPRPVAFAAETEAAEDDVEIVSDAHVAAGKRGRGRPRGRPRRQVHFHVDPDEEMLLLSAVEKFGSQQKGLIAALQALQDIEVVRDEVERLAAQCENQRKLLDQAESIFNR
jgi:outer membrane biosynthesis protein TonB